MTRLFALTIVALLIALLAAGCSESNDEPGSVTIGALLPLTGALASYGETSAAALDDALQTLNSGGKKVELLVEDTKTEPPTALAKLQDFNAKGVKVVIGPYSSSEVREVKQYADDNGIILISPLSTARTLAVAGDNVLRFTPDDELEGAAIAALARADGIRVIVAVSRDDPGNLGLQSAFKASFEKLGGRVTTGVTYRAGETDFKDEAITIAEAIVRERAGGPVGVYLTAFSEVTSLFSAVVDAGSEAPNAVAWYGSDSVALSKELVADAKAAAFAFGAGYPNPILGLRDADQSKWGPVSDRLAKKLSRTPDAFALAAYDALYVAVEAFEATGSGDVAKLRASIVSIANGYTGLTGPTRLNDAGDRALGNYDFWSVCRSGATWTWFKSATYTVGNDGTGKTARFQPSC